MSEHDEQSAVIQWADSLKGSAPELALLFAVPNGGHPPSIPPAPTVPPTTGIANTNSPS